MKRIMILVVVLGLLVPIFNMVPSAEAQGGLDLDRYCRDRGWSHSTNVDGTAYGWRCVDSTGGQHSMDLNTACREQHGSNYHAEYRNFNDPYSWQCISSSGTPPQQDPPQTNSNPPLQDPPQTNPPTTDTLFRGSSSPLSGSYIRVNISGLRIRTGPSTGNTARGHVVQGNYYQLLEQQNGWGRISTSRGEGWVYLGSGYVTVYGSNSSNQNDSGQWCSASPNQVANFGWSREGHLLPNPRLELRFSSSANFNDGSGNIVQPYYIYYNQNWVGAGVAQFQGWDDQVQAWTVGISTSWYLWRNARSLGRETVLNPNSWRIDYYRSSGPCTIN